MCDLLQITPLLHCRTGVIQPIARVCFVERLTLHLCVICVAHELT